MNKILSSIAALALVFSSVSCRENASETITIKADEVYETPIEVIETPQVEEIETTVMDTIEVDTIEADTAVVE